MLRVFSLFVTGALALEGSFNSFIRQVGFCKLQGFDTVSRTTSASVPMFFDGRLSFGVGTRFDSTSYCGRCLRISGIDRFAEFSFELDAFIESNARNGSIDAIIFDQCLDPVCAPGYLDFDIYSQTQPVSGGNPTGITWDFIPCPVLPGEFIEILFCFSNTCHEGDGTGRKNDEILGGANPYYWTAFIRNSRCPIHHVFLPEYGIELRDNNGWVYDNAYFNFSEPFDLQLNHVYPVTIDLPSHPTIDAYRGGILVPTNVQN